MSLLQVKRSKDVALELNSLGKTLIWQAGVEMVLGNANAIDAVLKVKAIWIAVCFTAFKRAVAALRIKAWFDAE
jgi:aspartate/methionine/tyrosine aminotransferase